METARSTSSWRRRPGFVSAFRARRGHNKQGRHDLRQVGLTYLLDGKRSLSLCPHVYPGNVSDAAEFPAVLPRVTRLLDEAAIPRDSVTLVFDKGTAALANTVALREAGVGWVSALPWIHAAPSPSTTWRATLVSCAHYGRTT